MLIGPGWMTQLSTVLEVSVAVADLIHIQESSVLVCLENGWDATAQVREGGVFIFLNAQ